MTTPDTSAVRAWARDNGYDVADRGRLPADVTDAFLAARRPAPAKKKAATPPSSTAPKPASKAATPKPANKTAAKKAPASKAPAGKAVRNVAAEQAATPAPKQEQPAPAPTVTPAADDQPRPKPSVVTDDRRLVALGEEIAALTKRVEALEQASRGSSGGSKSSLFRRRS